MNLFFYIMAGINFFMMTVQNDYKDRIPFAFCCIVSMLIIGAQEIIPLFLA